MKTITVIDTFGFFFRAFYALPPLKNKDGFPTGLLLGFCNLLSSLYRSTECSYIIFALEGGGVNRRKILYPPYKQNRQETPQDLILQLPIAIEWISKMNLLNLSVEGYEADDIIASVASLAQKEGLNVQIISHDKDLYQLINNQVHIYDPIKKKVIGEKECEEKFGVLPSEFVDYQSLVGDSADNITGIKGIGAKSASKLIKHFGSLESLYERADEIPSLLTPRLAKLIVDSKNEAFISKQLVSLVRDIPLEIDFNACQMPSQNPLLSIVEELKEYEFKGILNKILGPNSKTTPNTKYANTNAQSPIKELKNTNTTFGYEWEVITDFNALFELLKNVPNQSPIAFDTESDSLDTRVANIVGFSFCLDGKKGYYVPIGHIYLGVGQNTQMSKQEAKKAIEMIFTHTIIGHNLKFDIALVKKNFSIEPQGEIVDTMILSWLLDSTKPVGLDKQMLQHFNHKMISFDSVVDKDKNFANVEVQVAGEYATEDAVATFCLHKHLIDEFAKRDLGEMLNLAHSLEFPFIKVLCAMESKGICIDTILFEQQDSKISKILHNLTQEIYKQAGENFNINSPQQLSNLLFHRLGLQSGRAVKGGLSTDEATLNKIVDSHPIIPLILDYREMNKLKNTYIEPLLKYAKQNAEHKIYTSFLQTGTVTGRLSSKSPNLQNIPVRSEYGREIRRGFIAQDDCVLISVDYSQIELRLLAHFSQDSLLIQSFMQDKDIHYETALRLFGESQAQSKRAIAKSINFGLIYGMGARKLGETLKIPTKEAKQYIDSYFELFPTVKDYLNTQKELLLQNGYSQTLLGRRRYFDFANASEFMKANFLREGVNCIFQGSAADLIKLSMLELYKQYHGSDLQMLLQVHDELIFQAPKQSAKDYLPHIQSIMNTIYTLNVPLKCNASIATNWAQLK